MKLADIVTLVGGTLAGDGTVEIQGVRSVDSAGEGHITLLTKKKFLDQLNQSGAAAVIVDQEIETDRPQVIVKNPMLAFARVVAAFHPEPRPEPGVDPGAVIGQNVILGNNVTIFPLVCIGDDVKIGDNTVLHPGVVVGQRCRLGSHTTLFPNVTLYRDTVVGDHVTLHAGAVIGSDGFGYTLDEQGRHYKINQVGRVVIEDNVEIGANTCIDRASMGTTLIKKGTKMDNLVQVAHNCTVGEHNIFVAQAGVAGSCVFGHHVVLAGQAGVADHVTIGDQVTLAARAAAARDIESNSVHGGSPSVPMNIWRKYVTLFPKLPDLVRKIRELESRLKKIEK